MTPDQLRLLEKVNKKYSLGNSYQEILASLYLPSDKLQDLLDNLYTSELGLLKSIYYECWPDFTENICDRFANLGGPLLSIITSVYNGDGYIEEFMKNTCNQQGFHHYELILIDCNSPGSEWTVIQKYTSKHENIRYIRLDKDPGLYEAWNIGAREAKGTYLSNANLDDRKSPAYYSILLNYMMCNDYDLISSLFWTCRVLPENDVYDWPVIWYKNAPCRPGYLDFVKMEDGGHLQGQCLLGPFPIWKKSLHKRIGYFDEAKYGPSADLEFWLRAICYGAKHYFYKVPLGFYLKDPNSYARRTSVDEFNDRILREKFSYLSTLC